MSESGKQTSSSLRKLAGDVTGTFGTRMVTMVFGLVTGMITARMLGPENRGIFALAALFPATLVTLSKLGQNQGLDIFHPAAKQRDVSQVASNILILALCTGAVLMGVTVLLRDWLTVTILRGVPVWALLAVLPLIPILLVESYFYGVLQSTDRFRVYNTRLLSEAVLTVTGMAVALVVLEAGLPGALTVAVGVRVLMTIWVIWTNPPWVTPASEVRHRAVSRDDSLRP